MHSRGDRTVVAESAGSITRAPSRGIASRAERIARALAMVLVAFGVWRVLMWQPAESAPLRVDRPLPDALPALTAVRSPMVQLPLARVPNVVERDWLVALRRAGTAIAWSDAGLPPATGISVTQILDPAGGVAIAFATSGAGSVIVADTLGEIDSIAIGQIGARIRAASVHGGVTASRDSIMIARASSGTVRKLRPVLVVGSASWETKFTAAALEERGWDVHQRVRVAPAAVVTQGRQPRIDTAAYGAVILLDSASAPAASQLLAYVRQGGGLVLAGDAARVPALAGIVPARPGRVAAGSLLRSASAGGREGLPIHPLVGVRTDAIVIDQRDGHVAVAARREGAGRVIVVGETESWRWRMTRGAEGVAEHRRWWSGLVSSAAYAPAAPISLADPENAPYAALVEALGAPVTDLASAGRPPGAMLPTWLGAAILALLLFEWTSRRLRGAR